MRELTLDELPRHSPWPARLLGLAPVRDEPRDAARILREYDRDKYGTLLAALDAEPGLTADDLKVRELGDPGAPVVMSLGAEGGERLLLAPMAEAFGRTTELIVERVRAAVEAAGAAAVADLGCGYGFHLARIGRALPQVALHGGEFTPAGVELARRLHGDAIRVERFDFLAGEAPPLAHAPAPVVVLMSYALHQLPSSAPALEVLARHRDRIAAVVVVDADASVQPDGLLGLLRRRYIEVNAYSWDVLECLRARDDVVIDAVEPNVIGPNALLPATVVVFRFR